MPPPPSAPPSTTGGPASSYAEDLKAAVDDAWHGIKTADFSPSTVFAAFIRIASVSDFAHCNPLPHQNFPPHPAPPEHPPAPPPPAVSGEEDAQMDLSQDVPAPPTAPVPTPPQGPLESWAAVTTRSKGPQAPKVKLGAPPSQTTPAKAKPADKPCSRHNQVVIHIGCKSHYTGNFSGEEALLSASRAINSALASTGQSSHCLGVRCSQFGNLVVVFLTNTSRNVISATFKPIRAALQLPGNPWHPDAYVRLSLDCHWSFLSMANVPTRAPDSPNLPYDPAQLLAEVRLNPAFKDLAFTCLPSWVSDPKNLTKSQLSIAFAFEDPSGTLVDRLHREEAFLFGASVCIKSWSPSKPAVAHAAVPTA
ncbi:hypothetical protein CTheo_8428 [Ceratobasidium theobromae]|uniref:Uncharacterized protein n=1 Tax=Ceratobasidium theobromae TaxID=1582974 RepID=A0A5N5Q9P5_9AGAM|nr:hypothetical protein CTheo_8428 [Ceratobasidium theobromae]